MINDVGRILTDMTIRGIQPEDQRELEGIYRQAEGQIKSLSVQVGRLQQAVKLAMNTAQEETMKAQMAQMENDKLRKTNAALMSTYAELFQVTDAHITSEIMRVARKNKV